MNELNYLDCHWEVGCEPEVSMYNAGIDLRSKDNFKLTDQGVFRNGEHIRRSPVVMIPTGFYVEIPLGYYGFLIPRSGKGTKEGLMLANTNGIIDPDYRGEVMAAVKRDSLNYPEPLVIEKGERFCQLIVQRCMENIQLNWKETLSDTVRGASGFGDSGKF